MSIIKIILKFICQIIYYLAHYILEVTTLIDKRFISQLIIGCYTQTIYVFYTI